MIGDSRISKPSNVSNYEYLYSIVRLAEDGIIDDAVAGIARIGIRLADDLRESMDVLQGQIEYEKTLAQSLRERKPTNRLQKPSEHLSESNLVE